MPREIKTINMIRTLTNHDLKSLAKELFHLEEVGVYPKNSKLNILARDITLELDGIHLSHAQEMVNSEVLRVIARKFVNG